MIPLTLLSLVALASASLIPNSRTNVFQKRQLMALPPDPWKDIQGAKALPPFVTKDLKPEHFPQATRKRVLWGPFTLQAANGTRKGSGIDSGADGITKSLSGLCTNCMLLKADYELSSKEGKRLEISDGVYIHHIIASDTSQKGPGLAAIPSCGGPLPGAPAPAKPAGGMPGMPGMGHTRFLQRDGPGGHGGAAGTAPAGPDLEASSKVYGAVMVAKGEENEASLYAAPGNSTIKSGFYIGSTDTIGVNIEAINYKTHPQEVYLSIDFEYVDAGKGG